jgi:hypothetical protein
MLTRRARCVSLVWLAILLVPAGRAADPTDNPVATFYSGPEGYPAWTDEVNWSHVINMATYAKGKTLFEKFERARDELSEGGGVLYYPAGTYDFSTMPPGRGLMLSRGVVIRGDAPAGRPIAADGKLELPTKFVFGFRERGGGKVPRDWNIISLQPDDYKHVKDLNDVGVAWVHLVGATIDFGPEVNWGKTWASAGGLLSSKLKEGWGARDPSGSHPIDALAGGGKKYLGAGRGRLVFGCVLEDAALLDDFSDPGYGPDGFSTSPYVARIAVYGSRVLVANNFLPASHKNFRYRQKTTASPAGKATSTVQFDYGKTIGIDVNKELLTWARADGSCPGYFEEGVVVRDNDVYNHGHTGYNISGSWVTVAGNQNERAFLRGGDDVLTLDGWEAAGKDSDNRSRAFDLAGRNLWIDGNRFTNTGSSPGKDGEGIVCRARDGTPVYSCAITHNTHTRGDGAAGGIGGLDADCQGLLIAWNQTPGWVGDLADRKDVKMTDCAFVANQCDRVVPDDKTVARLGAPAPRTAAAGALTPPTKVTAAVYQADAVKVAWAGGSEGAIGFRVDRRIADGKWQAIAYRPPRPQGDPENPREWIDFTAPPGKDLSYRVAAIDADDTDKGASEPTEAVSLVALTR